MNNLQMMRTDETIDVIHGAALRRVVAAHHHERYAIGVATSGVHQMRCRGATFFVEGGDVVVLAPGEMHGAEPADEAGWSYEMVYIPDVFIDAAVDGTRASSSAFPTIREPVLKDRELQHRVRRVCVARLGDYRSLALDEAVVSTVHLLFTRHSIQPSQLRPGREPKAVREVQSILRNDFGERVRLAGLAAHVGLNANYLISVFTRATGVPPHRYLDQVRIARAQALIGEGHSLSYVAAAVGYCDQSHLTRHFKRLIGVTPGVYRQFNRKRI